MLNSQNTHLIETSYDRLKSEITFQQYRKILLKQEFSRWVTNIREHKRYCYTFDNSLLFTESIRTLHKSFLPPYNACSFLQCQHQRHVGIMQYVYALNPVTASFNYSRTLPQFPVRAVDIVNPEYSLTFICT